MVDSLDKLVRTDSCQRKSRRWPMVFFENILDIAAYNGYIVVFTVNPDIDRGKPQRRRLFLEKLAVDLITPAIEQCIWLSSQTPFLHHFQAVLQKLGHSGELGAACALAKLIEKR